MIHRKPKQPFSSHSSVTMCGETFQKYFSTINKPGPTKVGAIFKAQSWETWEILKTLRKKFLK